MARTKRRGISPRLRFQVFKRDGFKCRYCGASHERGPLVVDHYVPVALGGSDHINNLRTACELCNAGKAALPPEIGPDLVDSAYQRGFDDGADFARDEATFREERLMEEHRDEILRLRRAAAEELRASITTTGDF